MRREIFPRMMRLLLSGNCLTEQQLAGYAEQQLTGGERQEVEQHLTSCDACLHQLGFIIRSADAEPIPPPPGLIRRAQHPDRHTVFPGRRWHWAVAGIAGLVLVAVVTLTWRTQSPVLSDSREAKNVPAAAVVAKGSVPSPPAQSKQDEEYVRGGPPRTGALTLLYPSAGATVSRSGLKFGWGSVPHAQVYEVRVVSADGDLVWQQQISGTSVVLPKSVELRAGEKYYVWLRVRTTGGDIEQSPAVGFLVGDSSD